MYIQRSILLLFVFVYLTFLLGLDWINAPDASWYRPYLLAFGLIVVSAILQYNAKHDEY